jgi:hypothetical protein
MGISGNATSRIVTAWPERVANRPRPVPPVKMGGGAKATSYPPERIVG